MVKRMMLALCAVLLVSTAARAQEAEMVENPQYAAWKSHAVGTSVSLSMDMSMAGMNMQQKAKQTLKSVADDQIIVEMEVEFMGQQNKQEVPIPAKVKKGNELLPEGVEGTAKVTGREKVTVAGKEYDCEVVEIEGQQEGNKMKGKVYRTNDIPGGVAKVEMSGEMPGGQSMTMTMVVTEFSKK